MKSSFASSNTLTQKERGKHKPINALDILVVFKSSMRKVAGLDNGTEFQEEKKKAGLVCI